MNIIWLWEAEIVSSLIPIHLDIDSQIVLKVEDGECFMEEMLTSADDGRCKAIP